MADDNPLEPLKAFLEGKWLLSTDRTNEKKRYLRDPANGSNWKASLGNVILQRFEVSRSKVSGVFKVISGVDVIRDFSPTFIKVRFYNLRRRVVKTYVNSCSAANAIRGAAIRMATGAINLTILK